MASQGSSEGPRIYNVFPLLAGPLPRWQPHLERARNMEFNWIFINPVQATGISGSLYSISDYYAVNPLLTDLAAGPPEQQLRRMIESVHGLGMRLMMDLVINHTAADSPLVREHPEWYQRDASGQLVHPGAYEDKTWITWKDLAAVDNAASPQRQQLWDYWLALVRHYAALGVDGFRCDAAYQVPTELWRFLIGSARREFPPLQFFAETLGCTPEQTLAVANTGFDYIFNSSKWWDFAASWCLDQLRRTAPIVPSISFPESHDTVRLAEELGGNREAVRQRYFFAALFSTGVMIPMGFEYGFRRRLHVVNTRPEHWESPAWDDCEFIRSVNGLKAGRRIWNEDAAWESHDSGNPAVVALHKKSRAGSEAAVLFLNKDFHRPQPFDRENTARRLGGHVSSAWPHSSESHTIPPAGYHVLLAE